MSSSRLVAAFASLILVAAPLTAQTDPQKDTVDLRQLRQLRAEAEGDQGLTDEERARILEVYDVAISSLDRAENNRAAAAEFERSRAGIDQSVARLRADLERPEPKPVLALPENPTMAQACSELLKRSLRVRSRDR